MPIYTSKKQNLQIDQRNLERMQQKHEYEELISRVSAKIQQKMIDYQALFSQVNLYRGMIIPQSQQVVDAMMVGYQVGKIDFTKLLDSLTKLHDYQTKYWKVFIGANQTLADLTATVGEESIYE